MKWIKRVTNRHSHPDIQAVGFWGSVAFDEVCAVAGEFDLEGEVPAKYASAGFLARRLGLHDVEGGLAGLKGGIQSCLDVGLLEELEDGGLGIPGWDGIQSDSSTPRVQKHRAKKRAEQSQETPGSATETNVTVTSVSPLKGGTSETGSNGPEERREEEKRIEEPPPTPSAGAAGAPSSSGKGRRKSKRPEVPSEVGARVLARLNELGGGAFRYSPHLEARIAEGVPEADLMTVLEVQARRQYMRENPEYFRPKTLFGPDNFREYLATAKATRQPPGPPVRLVGGIALETPAPEPEPREGDFRLRVCPSCHTHRPHRWTGEGWVVAYHGGCSSPASTSPEAQAALETYRVFESSLMAEAAP